MLFEWDEKKNNANIERHGISFELAQKIFDGFTVTQIDNRQNYGEIREISLGVVESLAVIVVVHTDRDGTCRIISARQANKREREIYEQKIRTSIDT